MIYMDQNAKSALNQMKHEIANELGMDQVKIPVNSGDATSREYGFYGGIVGGEMTKRLVEIGERQLLKTKRN